MPRRYRHIKEFEIEILKLKEDGLTHQQIGDKLGFTKEQIKEFFKRYHKKQKKIEAGVALRKKGRPPKGYEFRKQDKIAELKYIIARKDTKIKTLEMENELMRDFLLLIERK